MRHGPPPCNHVGSHLPFTLCTACPMPRAWSAPMCLTRHMTKRCLIPFPTAPPATHSHIPNPTTHSIRPASSPRAFLTPGHLHPAPSPVTRNHPLPPSFLTQRLQLPAASASSSPSFPPLRQLQPATCSSGRSSLAASTSKGSGWPACRIATTWGVEVSGKRLNEQYRKHTGSGDRRRGRVWGWSHKGLGSLGGLRVGSRAAGQQQLCRRCVA